MFHSHVLALKNRNQVTRNQNYSLWNEKLTSVEKTPDSDNSEVLRFRSKASVKSHAECRILFFQYAHGDVC
jgi:hypothetical protein